MPAAEADIDTGDAENRSVADWTPREPIPRTPMIGRYVRHTMLVPKLHGPKLWTALGGQSMNDYIKYMFWPRIETADHFVGHLNQLAKKQGSRSLFGSLTGAPVPSDLFVTHDLTSGTILGLRGYVEPDLRHGTVECGSVIKTPGMLDGRRSIEAEYLAARRVFDECGFRRYYCRCTAENDPVRRSVMRIGFRFEGILRNYRIHDGKSHGMAWYSITAEDWPLVRRAMEDYLYGDNFDADGKPRRRVQDIRAALEAEPFL